MKKSAIATRVALAATHPPKRRLGGRSGVLGSLAPRRVGADSKQGGDIVEDHPVTVLMIC